MNIIKIRGLEVCACHGVHGYEKTTPQPFIFDADVFTDFSAAAESDSLTDTINYSAVCDLIVSTATQKVYNLIEKLAYEVAYSIMENFTVSGVHLTVYKPQAPVKHKFGTVGVSVELKKERVYLSLGSSLGDRKKYLDEGLKKLNATRGVCVKKVSSYINTAPYGGVAQNEFLNCAAEIETFLSPRQLLNEIHRIEAECLRTREKHWGDRTLDIDIIFFGQQIICEDDLIIPHPEYFKRQFVLEPLKEIAPFFVCPLYKKRINGL